MVFCGFAKYIAVAVVSLLALVCATASLAQSGTGSLRGQVTDPSGAAVPNATVEITTPAGRTQAVKTGRDGAYEAKGLAPGKYMLRAAADGFEVYQGPEVEVAAGQAQKVDFPLVIPVQQQKVEVSDNSIGVSISPENNAGAIVLSGKDLESLSDDPDQLQSDLAALAGPSVGPNGGQMYIDGFTAGQLPPKASIREIRINQNPFSAEYDELGYGRIEIFTKPGTDQFHGQFFVLGNDSAFNSRNPFLDNAALPGYYTVQYNGNLGGPLSKKSSFFFTAERRDIHDVQVVNAELQPNTIFTQAVPNPRLRTNISPRLDYQVSRNNTLSLRYQYYRNTDMNDGVGRYALPSQGYNVANTEQTLRISDTQVFGGKIVNEMRFQYLRDRDNQIQQNNTPTVIVPFEFNAGGSNSGKVIDNQDRYELQNYTSIALGKHFLKFGARLRDVREANSSTANYNGTFVFRTLAAFQATEKALEQGLAPPAADYPVQFSLTTGVPTAAVNLFDAGLYVQDDWKWRPNLTVSAGLRFESQNDISDHADWAPRLGFAWGIGSGTTTAPKTVVRGGWGIFYDRFTDNLVLQAERQNGVVQQEFIVADPSFFPNIPTVSSLRLSPTGIPTIYQVAPNLHAPYTMQTAVSLERQISRVANMTLSYIHAGGVHQLLTDNINAPLPGTYVLGQPTSGKRPLQKLENVYQYESEGIFRQNQLIANFNVRAGTKLSLFGYYTLSYANSDTSGATSFPTNPYHISSDYGRAGFDVRHRVFVGGTMTLPHGFRINPFMLAASGAPFNVTTGLDANGDSILNDRPALASTTVCAGIPKIVAPNTVCTPLGTFNTLPAPGQKTVPINAYTGPGQFTMNLRIAKTFGFGAKREAAGPLGGPAGAGGLGGFGRRPGAGGGRGPGERGPGGLGGGGGSSQRYSITLSVNARNLFNIVNPGSPAGNLGSRKFDTSNALASGAFGNSSAVRLIQLQAQFNF
jgi:hypothetical protein